MKQNVTEKETIQAVCNQMGISTVKENWQEQLSILEDEVNRLLLNDFDQLVSILYRVDVNESKLKQMLREHPDEDAAKLITALLIERQHQKIKTRREFTKPPDQMDEEERW